MAGQKGVMYRGRSPKLLESCQGKRFPSKVSTVLESFCDALVGHFFFARLEGYVEEH